MTAVDVLRQQIDRERQRAVAGIPADPAAILALIQARDRRGAAASERPATPVDLITGLPVPDLGGNLAVGLCLAALEPDAGANPGPISNELAAWATALLAACDQLAAAELALARAESGFFRLVASADGGVVAWIATKRTPASWWERADFAWWAAWSAAQQAAARREAAARWERGDLAAADFRREDARLRVAAMSYQLPYPADAVLGGVPVRTYQAVLAALIARALRDDVAAPPAVQATSALAASLAAELGLTQAVAAQAISGFTLDRAGAGYHAAVPGIAAAPLIQLDAEHVIWSRHGLTTEPLLFLARELRRRDPEAYHNAAHQRETLFREDLYRLFADKRFVTSARRIELRRADGNARTDLDAAVFDRKSGAVGLFELKSQDPFARSTAERTRQRDSVLQANRQVAGALDWINRQGADALLGRLDAATAKRFRVQKVFPFVLGRYLAHFGDGAPPDPRAAWGTWPQVLRGRDGQPFAANEANPLATLFTRLSRDDPPLAPPATAPPRIIAVGDLHLTAYASYAALQASEAARASG